MSSNAAPIIPVLASVVVLLALAGLVFFFVLRRSSKRRIERSLKAIATEQLRNVFVPDGMGGQVHLDRLLLTKDGLLVLDVRDVSGNVFGAAQMNEWTVLGNDGRWTFPNPTGPLNERVIAVRALAQSVPVEGHIVFTPGASFPRGVPEQVLTLDQLVERYRGGGQRDEPSVEAFYTYWSRIREVAQPA